jgi:hypothetical protein
MAAPTQRRDITGACAAPHANVMPGLQTHAHQHPFRGEASLSECSGIGGRWFLINLLQ